MRDEDRQDLFISDFIKEEKYEYLSFWAKKQLCE